MTVIDWLYRGQYRLRLALLRRLCPRAGRLRELTERPSRVLIVLRGHIGDTVMCTPLVLEARRAWPSARIALLAGSQNGALFSACPAVDEVRVTDCDPLSIRRRREVEELFRWIDSQRFDVGLIALGDQYAHLLAKAKIPFRVGVRGTPLEGCLTHRYTARSAREWGPADRLNALRCLGIAVKELAPSLCVDERARRSWQRLARSRGIATDEPYLLVHAFGSSRRQWWPWEFVGPLCSDIDKKLGWKVVIVGGPETCEPKPVTPTGGIDLRGVLDVRELVAAVAGASLVISTDSGPFHVAGALGRPVVGLFRAARPEHASRYLRARVLLGDDSRCAGSCSWNRCRQVPCRQMNALLPEAVLAEALAVVGESRRVAIDVS